MVTFSRGIHPQDNKDRTKNKSIEKILPRKNTLLYYSMQQHIGSSCKPVVEIGQRVLQGERLGDCDSYVASPVFSSVSGEVKAISYQSDIYSKKINTVVVENDGLFEQKKNLTTNGANLNDTKEILTKIRNAGVVGLGGAGFPTHVKLNPPKHDLIHTVIVNGAECEPYLTSDYRLMLEENDQIIQGTLILKKLFPNATIFIALEDNKKDAIELFKQTCKNYPFIKICACKTKYPQGAEKQLIKAITGIEIPSKALPYEVGCIMDNVDTVIAISRAVNENLPLMRRVVTFSGDCVNRPGNYEVLLGMRVEDFITDCGGLMKTAKKYIVGGPMMGKSIVNLDAGIPKTMNSLLVFSSEFAKAETELPCIRCGRCVDHCPMGLEPLFLNAHVLHEEFDKFIHLSGMDCIECGTCSYVCPSKRHLVQSFGAAKKMISSKEVNHG